MSLDIGKLFNEKLPKTLARHSEKAKEIDSTFQINVVGADGGAWWIDLSEESGPKAEQGHPRTAECTVEVTADDFQELLGSPRIKGLELYFSGRLKVEGSLTSAAKLSEVLELIQCDEAKV